MTDSMKFGPEWLRNLSSDGTQTPPAPKYQLAEFRYGREEMLALFDRQVRAPEHLPELQSLYVEKTQPPLALIQMTEEETRMWNRGINSDAVLRLNGKPAPISIPGSGVAGRGSLVGGRGGSVDRGRGRARGQGSYHYARGISYEETGESLQDPSGKLIYNRNAGRPFDRAQSMAGSERGWGERNGGDPQDWNGSTSPRKEFVRGFDNNWRRPRGTGGEDEEGWRTATATGSTKYVRPSSWREGDKEGGEVGGGGGGRWEGPRVHRGWDGDSHRHHTDPDNLPEWAMENPSESGGSFDASGAFHGGAHSEDDEDGGAVNAGGEPGRDRKPSEGSTSKRRSPEDTKKTPPPHIPSHPPPSIAKSQSTPAMPSTNVAATAKSSPAKTQQQQQQQHHPSQGSAIRHSPSEPAFQIPLQMIVNNGDSIGKNQVSDKVPQSGQFALNDSSILSTKFHNANNIGYDQNTAAQHFHANQMMHNGGGVQNSFVTNARFVTPHGGFNAPVPGGFSTTGPGMHDLRGHRKNDEDLDRMQEDADHLVDKLTADEEEKIHKMAAVKQSLAGQENWFYRDPQSDVQGPFAAQEMDEWFSAGYFNVNLLIRRGCDERFSQLGDLIKTWGRVPFRPGPTMPPLKNDHLSTPPPTPAHIPQSKPLSLEAEAIMQQQFQYQQLLQRQAQVQLGQQAAFQAVLGQLSQSDRWSGLSTAEQQQLILQQMVDPSVFLPQHQKPSLHQQFIPSSKPLIQSAPEKPNNAQHPLQQLIQQMGGQTPSPIGQPPGPMGHQGLTHKQEPNQLDQDPLQSLIRQINANAAKPQMDVWGNPLSAQSWLPQVGQMPTAPPPGQLPISLWDLQGKDMKTEQQIIDERLRAEEEKRVEEAKKKEAEEKRRKHEDEQKRKEMEKQRLEQERQRQERQMEEVRRKEEEEKRVLEDQKRLEEEVRKKEEKKRKEEEKKKREEDKRKKEEEKERKRKLEEDRKREDEEKKRQAAQDEEDAARKRAEEEEQVRRLEQQHQAFRRMERAKAAPWSQQPVQQPAGSSLAEIQRQEKVQKERESREQQVLMQSMIIQHQQIQQAAMLQAAADSKASSQLQLKWADRKPQPPASKVKSLSEIQAEEAKLSEREKAERALLQKEGAVPPSAGIWSAAPQSLTWASAAPVAWGTNNIPQGGPVGFWDDVIPAPKPAPVSRPAPKPKAAPVNHTTVSQPAAKTQAAKTRNKKEEAVVMKLFDNQRIDDFTQWCYATLRDIAASVDIETFVGFLRDIESPYEVRDYAKMYLGEGKEAQEFARQFLERRSKWRSAQRAAPQHDDLAQPAPAINPSSTDFQEVKGKAKKIKKNKMFKVDNRILGFSVTAAQDRINVGDRDYGEGV